MLSSLGDSAHQEVPSLHRELTWMAKLSSAQCQRILMALELAPDPVVAERHLVRFWQARPASFQDICESSTALGYLITVFSHSRFLSEAVTQHPQWILECASARDLYSVLSTREYTQRLSRHLADQQGVPLALLLARFRRRELLRILLRDVLEMGTLSDVTEELSNLADAILNAAYQRVRRDVGARLQFDPAAEFSVIALGKLGGRELNYSSDIDLMFVFRDGTSPQGNGPVTSNEFLRRVAHEFTKLLSTYTAEGMCYRVDLRLRPDGRYGEVCHSLAGATGYYRKRARDWELQMLIKARVCAGESGPGLELLRFVEPLIYSTTLDFNAVEAVAESRDRIHEKMRHSSQHGLDIKLARGGIRDIEFLVQCLQRLHGGREPWVRHGGTILALFRLRDKNFLSDREYARLLAAYQFLRHLEHRLQVDEDRQTHSLPSGEHERSRLARAMPGRTTRTADALEHELNDHLEAVSELYDRVIHTNRLRFDTAIEDLADDSNPLASTNLLRFIEARSPAVFDALGLVDRTRAGARLENLLEELVARPEWLQFLEDRPEAARCVMDLFSHSEYFSDQLIRDPALIEQVAAACAARQGRTGFAPPADSGELRRFFRQQMLRIQSDSVYHSVNVFRTLERTSALADSVIRAAYRLALNGTGAQDQPEHMMVIALGRLGMREFDLGSDADLVFVLPDQHADDLEFWTGVAERMIAVISAYTGDGMIFSVDTRLRPNGRSGPLVQTTGVFFDYFALRAEAWEGISYMKARAVAGDIDETTTFLGKLQEVDWRRNGQDGRSRKELSAMRARLEREQGARNPLKAAPGGYYDIDFALLYLRLKGAGFFFPVLNTPERIDIVEKMGHLEREDAEFLREASSFYRAVDHGLRVATGHAEGRLPTSPAQLTVLTQLVNRWSPEHLRDQTLENRLCHYRSQTRRFYDRLFA